MAFLTREMIEKASELKTEVVEVPEWGGDVLIRELTGSERDAYEASLMAEKRGGKPNVLNLRARLVGKCLIDPDTKQRLYTDQEIGILGNKSASALDRLFDACQKLSGMEPKKVEEAEKNSETVLSDGSGSDLPLPSVAAPSPNSKRG